MLCDILVTHNSFKCCFHSGKIFIIVLVQSFRLFDGCINCGIIGRFEGKIRDRTFNSPRHCINIALLSNVLVTDNSVDGSFHSREILVVILIQGICLSNGCIHFGIVSRVSSKYRIELALRESIAKRIRHRAIRKFINSFRHRTISVHGSIICVIIINARRYNYFAELCVGREYSKIIFTFRCWIGLCSAIVHKTAFQNCIAAGRCTLKTTAERSIISRITVPCHNAVCDVAICEIGISFIRCADETAAKTPVSYGIFDRRAFFKAGAQGDAGNTARIVAVNGFSPAFYFGIVNGTVLNCAAISNRQHAARIGHVIVSCCQKVSVLYRKIFH